MFAENGSVKGGNQYAVSPVCINQSPDQQGYCIYPERKSAFRTDRTSPVCCGNTGTAGGQSLEAAEYL